MSLRPWLDGFAELRDELIGLQGQARLDRLNALAHATGLKTACGLALHFVDQTDLRPGQSYEGHIAITGRVPTRLSGDGAIHDLYNALMWLRWPQSKARLNALHVQALHNGQDEKGRSQRPGVRGRLRDRLTLFDESGLVWVCEDASLNEALQRFRWQELFVTRRAELLGNLTVAVFGHAVLQKLEQPYKAITAHALILASPATAALPLLDARLARALADFADHTASIPVIPLEGGPALLCPIPVLGLPGWSPDNQDPGFYADEKIFRRGRRPGLQSAPERVGRSLRVPAPGEEGPDSGGQGAG